MDFEVCIDSAEGAILASKYGAKRVELCSALSEGGLTPGAGLIHECAKLSSADVFAMIRPSAGGFVYSDYELEVMKYDILAAHTAGAKGVVFGILTPECEIDIKRNVYLMETALELGLGTTFHRAFDLATDPLKSLNDIVNMGFDRILTSGQQIKAIEGIELIGELNHKGNGRIEIMAGSGINESNVIDFRQTGIGAIHFTAKKELNENLKLDMGTATTVDEEKIKRISEQL